LYRKVASDVVRFQDGTTTQWHIIGKMR